MNENKKDEEMLKVLDNGDIVADIEYPQKKVEISTKSGKFTVGMQPSYHVENRIFMQSIPTLRVYLQEQYDMFEDRLKAADDVIQRIGEIDQVDKMAQLLATINKTVDKRKYMKKLKHLDKFSQDCHMYVDAKKNREMILDAMDKQKKQIDFIDNL